MHILINEMNIYLYLKYFVHKISYIMENFIFIQEYLDYILIIDIERFPNQCNKITQFLML